MAQRLVAVTVHATASPDPATVHPIVMDIALPLIFTGFGPLPAVTGVRDQTGSWDHVGVSRRPVLSDGTTVFEQITSCSPPDSFAYEVSGLTNVLGRLVHGAIGSWDFARTAGGGTRIGWTYAFRPKRFRTLLVRLLIAPAWRLYMRRALAATRREVGRQTATTAE
ncbi:SRPBCC family protein [Streptomyces sp. NPDC058572]|uniref:SRPBCC family protein n=1 Tax=Streptomyces sp. NPDC058572 TaxID=3346546 RepID=UPI0036505D8A